MYVSVQVGECRCKNAVCVACRKLNCDCIVCFPALSLLAQLTLTTVVLHVLQHIKGKLRW